MTKKRKQKSSNPLLEEQQKFLSKLSSEERDAFFSTSITPHQRAALWMQQAAIGEQLVNKYAWATPDARAMKVLKHFSPIVEIGCGAQAYWCRTMKRYEIDVVGYDAAPEKGGKIASETTSATQNEFLVCKGGPSALAKLENKRRTLFLCYPDEDDTFSKESNDDGVPRSLGSLCLEHFKGDHVIHVGELFGDNWSMEQAPWGRSSAPEFQEQLHAQFHCLLKISLTNWLHVRDTLTVWKRSQVCEMVFAADGEEEDDDDEEVEYR
jgi:hypothetical protein